MNSAFIVAFTLAALFSTTATKAEKLSGIPSIVDGDTIDIEGTRIRLHGIDTPEPAQRCNKAGAATWKCGDAATDRLTELMSGPVTCSGNDYDDTNRLIAICRNADGTDLNQLMVSEGYAWAFRRYSEDYVVQEEQAKSQKIGIWQSDTETPWDFRASRWVSAMNEAPDKKCPIKGNISNNGKIYHMPWQRDYSKTGITPDRGERWFCDEQEAIAAGWRAAMR